MTKRRLLTYVAVGAGVVVVLGVAVAAFSSLKVPFTSPTSSPTPLPCSPRPCANVEGYTMWVSDLKVEGGLVTMQLTFRNASTSTHADPSDIDLIDANGNPSHPVYDASGCTHWPRTDFNHGAGFGPVPECFRPASTAPPLRLHWTPDMGIFCCETVIPLS